VNRERLAIGATLLAALLWGGSFVVIRDTLGAITPGALVFARFAVATLILSVALIARGGRVTRPALIGGVAAGLGATGGFLFQAIGLTATSAGSSAFITCAGTLFAGIFAWPLLGARPAPRVVVGIVVALAGAALLSLDQALRLGRGEWWTLLGALCFALQIVALAKWSPGADPIALALVQGATLALLTSMNARAALASLAALDAAGAWRFGYLALACSVIAPWLQVWAQGVLSPARIGLLLAFEPVFALAFAMTVGLERFEPRWWLGALLIVCAVLWVESRSSGGPASSP